MGPNSQIAQIINFTSGHLLRCFAAVVIVALGVVWLCWLLRRDCHFMILLAIAGSCGASAGALIARDRGAGVGLVLGLVALPVYVPFWLVFNLPPDPGLDL